MLTLAVPALCSCQSQSWRALHTCSPRKVFDCLQAASTLLLFAAKHSTLFPETGPPLPTAAACKALLGALGMLLSQPCIQSKPAARPRKGAKSAVSALDPGSILADTVKDAKDAALALSLIGITLPEHQHELHQFACSDAVAPTKCHCLCGNASCVSFARPCFSDRRQVQHALQDL